MAKRFLIHLTADERVDLAGLLRRKVLAKFKRQRAQIFLLADEGRKGGAFTDERIAEACHCSIPTVQRAREDLCDRGLPAALERAPSLQAEVRWRGRSGAGGDVLRTAARGPDALDAAAAGRQNGRA
jgi:hypothetical protein